MRGDSESIDNIYWPSITAAKSDTGAVDSTINVLNSPKISYGVSDLAIAVNAILLNLNWIERFILESF